MNDTHILFEDIYGNEHKFPKLLLGVSVDTSSDPKFKDAHSYKNHSCVLFNNSSQRVTRETAERIKKEI